MQNREKADHLRSQTARRYGVTETSMRRRTRRPAEVLARHAFWWLLHVEGLSLAEIGRIEGRDHTTIGHGVRCHEGRRAALRDRSPSGSMGRDLIVIEALTVLRDPATQVAAVLGLVPSEVRGIAQRFGLETQR